MTIYRFLWVILVYCVFAMPLQAQTLSIRADYWYPMNGDPKSDKPGYMIDLAKAIFEPHGITVDYRLMPWSRAIQETRLGRNDCVVGAYKSDTPDFLFTSEHWGVDKISFYKFAKDNWRYKGDTKDLINRKVGIINDYSYGKALDEVFVKMNVQSAKGDGALEINIRKLLSGRIDTTIESHYVMVAKLMDMNLSDQVISAGDTQQGEPMYIACSPNATRTKKFIEIMNKTLPQLKKSGRFKQILQKYNIESW
ncbi:substrate-binding periplasmic protein [Pseudomonas sp. HK3]